MVLIGATAIKIMPKTSVMMPKIEGAIMIAMVISAAFRRSFRWFRIS